MGNIRDYKTIFSAVAEGELITTDEIAILFDCSIDDMIMLLEESGLSDKYSTNILVEELLNLALKNEEILDNEDILYKIEDMLMITEDDINTPYEINILSARFIAETNNRFDHFHGIYPDINNILNLAESDQWQDRLVAAYQIINIDGRIIDEVKNLLREDPFSDDNGYFLIREAMGIY